MHTVRVASWLCGVLARKGAHADTFIHRVTLCRMHASYAARTPSKYTPPGLSESLGSTPGFTCSIGTSIKESTSLSSVFNAASAEGGTMQSPLNARSRSLPKRLPISPDIKRRVAEPGVSKLHASRSVYSLIRCNATASCMEHGCVNSTPFSGMLMSVPFRTRVASRSHVPKNVCIVRACSVKSGLSLSRSTTFAWATWCTGGPGRERIRWSPGLNGI